MKKFIYLFLSAIIASTTLTACSSDSSSSDGNGGASIAGSWEPVRMYGYLNGQEIYAMPYQHDCTSTRDYVIFNSGGNFTDYEYTETCGEIIEYGTYTLNGDLLKITMTVTEYEENYKVISVSNNKMIFEVNTTGEDEDEDFDMPMRIEFKKK